MPSLNSHVSQWQIQLLSGREQRIGLRKTPLPRNLEDGVPRGVLALANAKASAWESPRRIKDVPKRERRTRFQAEDVPKLDLDNAVGYDPDELGESGSGVSEETDENMPLASQAKQDIKGARISGSTSTNGSVRSAAMANVRSRLPGPTPNPPPRHLEFKTPAARPAAAGYPPEHNDDGGALLDSAQAPRSAQGLPMPAVSVGATTGSAPQRRNAPDAGLQSRGAIGVPVRGAAHQKVLSTTGSAAPAPRPTPVRTDAAVMRLPNPHSPVRGEPGARDRQSSRQKTRPGGPAAQDDLLTLHDQVEALTDDLETHRAGESRLQSINMQLRQRLEEYQLQNKENVARAEAELTALQHDMEKTLRQQNALEEALERAATEKHVLQEELERKEKVHSDQVGRLQGAVSQLGEEHAVSQATAKRAEEAQRAVQSAEVELAHRVQGAEAEAQRVTVELTYVRKKADEYASELRKLIEAQEADFHWESLATRSLQRRVLLRLQSSSRTSAYMRGGKELARSFRAAVIQRRFLKQWKLNRRFAVHGRALLARCEMDWLALALVRWHNAIMALRAAHHYDALARLHHARAMSHRTLKGWCAYCEMCTLRQEEFVQLQRAAALHFNAVLETRAIVGWEQWLEEVGRPRQALLRRTDAHYFSVLLKRVLLPWLKYCRWKARIRLGTVRAEHARTVALLRGGLKGLQEHVVLRAAIRGMQLAADNSLSALHWRHWRGALGNVVSERQERARGQELRARVSGRCHLRSWLRAVLGINTRRAAIELAHRHVRMQLMGKALAAWEGGSLKEQEMRQAAWEETRSMLRFGLSRWRGYLRLCRSKKAGVRRAHILRQRHKHRTCRRLFDTWDFNVVRKKRLLEQVEGMILRRSHTVLRKMMATWQTEARCALRETLVQTKEQLTVTTRGFDEKDGRLTSADMENLQLIDRLHELSSEVSRAQAQVTEKERVVQEMQQAAEEAAVVENSLRGDLGVVHAAAREHSEEAARLRQALSKQSEDGTSTAMQHAMERAGEVPVIGVGGVAPQEAIAALRAELEEKQQVLEACELALSETTERLNNMNHHTDTRVTSAFEMTTAMRQLLEEKEQRIQELQGMMEQQEMLVNSATCKATASEQALERAVEARDRRLAELESINSSLQADIHDSREVVDQARRARSNRDAEVTQLEYEVRLLSERQSRQGEARRLEKQELDAELLALGLNAVGSAPSASAADSIAAALAGNWRPGLHDAGGDGERHADQLEGVPTSSVPADPATWSSSMPMTAHYMRPEGPSAQGTPAPPHSQKPAMGDGASEASGVPRAGLPAGAKEPPWLRNHQNVQVPVSSAGPVVPPPAAGSLAPSLPGASGPAAASPGIQLPPAPQDYPLNLSSMGGALKRGPGAAPTTPSAYARYGDSRLATPMELFRSDSLVQAEEPPADKGEASPEEAGSLHDEIQALQKRILDRLKSPGN
ncbi:hypothetical protein CYMTET_3184 [Cymbomonas tetramitiformis]|uniref:Uncharacterized protein n=1 Tax=Cymbomonas tetramitiformis TaxID=36881 RepID=A0AAE0LLT4_9CHLO|nr:hypothetical protein CYMTET_3184 [Cymbomonas tetramitiformis]